LNIAPGHPQLLQDLYLDIKDVFLPPNSTYEIQPIDQTVIATFNDKERLTFPLNKKA
jgi:hypothetical protein